MESRSANDEIVKDLAYLVNYLLDINCDTSTDLRARAYLSLFFPSVLAVVSHQRL